MNPTLAAALLKASLLLGYPNINYSGIEFRAQGDEFICGAIPAYGCFIVTTTPIGSYGTIVVDLSGPFRKALAHESIHAIRWLAGEPDWDRHDKMTNPPEFRHRKWEEGLVIGTALFDIGTTEHILGSNPNLHEGNPLGGTKTARIGVKAASAVGILLLARQMDRKGHLGAARMIRWTTIAIWGSAGGWNLYIGTTVPVGGK